MPRGIKIVQPLEEGKYLASYRAPGGACHDSPLVRDRCVLYTPWVPTVPPIGWGPLSVFPPDIEVVDRFLHADYNVEEGTVEVWACDYTEAGPGESELRDGGGMRRRHFPAGTILASRVMLIGRMGEYSKGHGLVRDGKGTKWIADPS